MYTSNGTHLFASSEDGESIRSSGFSLDETSSQRSSLSRPSGKAIYLQRKGYAETMIKQPRNVQYRVEHLFTCEVDGRDVRDLEDCVEQLKVLDARGRVWGQDMVLEVQDRSLLLTDIETKEELESLPLASITETKALLDTCIYNSMLALTVQERSKGMTNIFLFQCEEVRAELVKTDLDRAIRLRMMDVGDTRNHVNNAVGQPDSGSSHGSEPPLSDRWNDPDYEEASLPPPREEPEPEYDEEPQEEPPPRVYTELERNVDILNHVLNDVELFMGRVRALVAKEDKKKKKILMMKKNKKKATEDMPPSEEFETCLQKVKFGFNLLGVLNGEISSPSAPEFTHIFFSILEFLVPHAPPDLPSSIIAPLLTDQTIKLLSEEANQEEDQLWQSLGDAWNIPSSKWPDDEDEDEVPPYFPEFDDGWEPPMVVKAPPKPNPTNNTKSQRPQPQPQPPPPPPTERAPQRTQPSQSPVPWNPPKPRPNEPPARYMRVMYDFAARNRRELSIMKDDMVQVLDQSKQWWRVRNADGEEGYVPHNVLVSAAEKQADEEPKEMNSPPTLNKRSKPEEVKAWLEYKEFSKITVRCLGVLSGSLLLGLTREELKQMCPEEGGRVFFQLQNVKNSLALANENGKIRYN
ncbi:epidermal growth factor receptor kinase substrate 8-like protein 3 [Anguilla rostrata]|uniref:epidermal growth factor receptor kinase substrate 8-like protein 3 n=1 Tax=Anguilla rostrata TaxID=7938 RepID=UPI0030D0D910